MVNESKHDVVTDITAEDDIAGLGAGHEKGVQDEVILDLCEVLRTGNEKNGKRFADRIINIFHREELDLSMFRNRAMKFEEGEDVLAQEAESMVKS